MEKDQVQSILSHTFNKLDEMIAEAGKNKVAATWPPESRPVKPDNSSRSFMDSLRR